MLFNLDECAVMHFGFNNIGESIELGGKVLVYIPEKGILASLLTVI